MYILSMALGLALQDARARSRRAASGAAMPFVACLGLIARLQLLLQLPHQHAHQAFLDSLHRARLEEANCPGAWVMLVFRLRKLTFAKSKKNGVSSSSIS